MLLLKFLKKKQLQEAKIELTTKLAEGKAGKLAGMVIGIKGQYLLQRAHKVGLRPQKLLDGFESLYNATVVERLLA